MTWDFGLWTLDFGPLLKRTSCAPAAYGFNNVLEIFPTVVISNFFTRLNLSLRINPHSAVFNYCLGIGATGMVRIARDIVAAAAVNRPPGVYAEEIFAVALVDDLIGKVRTGVFNNSGSLGNWMLRK